MATITVSRPDVFPDGTSISAYRRPTPVFPLPGPDRAPVGTAADTQTVSSGTATFTGLADGSRYVIVGLVGSDYRRLVMFTAETNTGLAGVQGATTAQSGVAFPSWRQRRRSLGLV
jgi:hypothetical protein